MLKDAESWQRPCQQKGCANFSSGQHARLLFSPWFHLFLKEKKGARVEGRQWKPWLPDRAKLEDMIYHAIRNKPLGHNFYDDSNIENIENKNMVQIGG